MKHPPHTRQIADLLRSGMLSDTDSRLYMDPNPPSYNAKHILYLALPLTCLSIWAFQNHIDMLKNEVYGLSIATWFWFASMILFAIVVCSYVVSLFMDILDQIATPQFHLLTRSLKQTSLFLKLALIFLSWTLLLDSTVISNCLESYSCGQFLFVRKILICGVITFFGLVVVKWIMAYISHHHQGQVFADRIILNRYKIHVANLLYEGCVDEARKRRLTIKHIDSTLSGFDSPGPSISEDSSDDEAEDHHPKEKSRLASVFAKMFRRKHEPPSLISRKRSELSIQSYKMVPSLDFATFKRRLTDNPEQIVDLDNADRLTYEEAKTRARFIFEVLHSLDGKKEDYVTMQSLEQIFKSKAAARETYRLFDANGDGKLLKAELKSGFVHIYRESNNLYQGILNSSDALDALHATISGIFAALVVLIYMTVFGMDIQSILTLALSIVLGFNAIIGNTAAIMFDSLCFLFVTHPFDVGDRIRIEGDDRIYEVKKMHILRTELEDVQGREIYVPNTALIKKGIINLRRSNDQWETIDLDLDGSVTEIQLELFRGGLSDFLKEHKSSFYHAFQMRLQDRNHHPLKIFPVRLRVQCKLTYDEIRRAERHHFLLNFVKTELDKHKIAYHPEGSSSASVAPGY